VPELYPLKDWRPSCEPLGSVSHAMANFSFDSGNVHWTVLDSNPYVYWDDPKLRELAGSGTSTGLGRPFGASWSSTTRDFIPPCSRGRPVMRLLSPVFEKTWRLTLCWGGHIHITSEVFPCASNPSREPQNI